MKKLELNVYKRIDAMSRAHMVEHYEWMREMVQFMERDQTKNGGLLHFSHGNMKKAMAYIENKGIIGKLQAS